VVVQLLAGPFRRRRECPVPRIVVAEVVGQLAPDEELVLESLVLGGCGHVAHPEEDFLRADVPEMEIRRQAAHRLGVVWVTAVLGVAGEPGLEEGGEPRCGRSLASADARGRPDGVVDVARGRE